MNETCTRKRIRKMFKYFRYKLVHVCYEYNNSLGMHQEIEDIIIYNNFEILGSGTAYNVLLKWNNKVMLEQELYEEWGFVGLGELQYCNSGPYCYFSIKEALPFIKYKNPLHNSYDKMMLILKQKEG
jgi:hypothetical protein